MVESFLLLEVPLFFLALILLTRVFSTPSLFLWRVPLRVAALWPSFFMCTMF